MKLETAEKKVRNFGSWIQKNLLQLPQTTNPLKNQVDSQPPEAMDIASSREVTLFIARFLFNYCLLYGIHITIWGIIFMSAERNAAIKCRVL